MSNTIEFIGVILSIIIASIMLNNSIHGRMDDLQSEIYSIRTDLGVSRSEIRDDMDTFQQYAIIWIPSGHRYTMI